MILVVVAGLALVFGWLRGGRVANLRFLGLRHEHVLLVVFLLQVIWPRGSQYFGADLNVQVLGWLLFSGIVVLVLLGNEGRIGLTLAAGGVALNAVAILSNWGMPVDATAASIAGMGDLLAGLEHGRTFYHVAEPSTAFLMLADVLPVPGLTGVGTVLSVGDMLLFIGVIVLVAAAMKGSG